MAVAQIERGSALGFLLFNIHVAPVLTCLPGPKRPPRTSRQTRVRLPIASPVPAFFSPVTPLLSDTLIRVLLSSRPTLV